MRIKKADYNKHGGIDYDCWVENKTTGAEEEDIKNGCREEPMDSLYKAFCGLRAVAVEQLPFLKPVKDKIEVNGFTITHKENGHMNIVLKLVVEMDEGKQAINTFNRPVTSEQSAHDLSTKSAKLVDDALQEVEKYINGERKQIPMNLEGGSQEAEKQEEMAGV